MGSEPRLALLAIRNDRRASGLKSLQSIPHCIVKSLLKPFVRNLDRCMCFHYAEQFRRPRDTADRFGGNGHGTESIHPPVQKPSIKRWRPPSNLLLLQTHSQNTRTLVALPSLPSTSTVRSSRWSMSSSRFSGLICDSVSGTPWFTNAW